MKIGLMLVDTLISA